MVSWGSGPQSTRTMCPSPRCRWMPRSARTWAAPGIVVRLHDAAAAGLGRRVGRGRRDGAARRPRAEHGEPGRHVPALEVGQEVRGARADIADADLAVRADLHHGEAGPGALGGRGVVRQRGDGLGAIYRPGLQVDPWWCWLATVKLTSAPDPAGSPVAMSIVALVAIGARCRRSWCRSAASR